MSMSAACDGSDGVDVVTVTDDEEGETAMATDDGSQTVPHPVALADVGTFLQDWLDSFAPAPSTPDDPAWLLALTPPLPLDWPPSDDTRWVRWVYARALRPGLADAELVSYSWASVELSAGSDEAIIRLVTPQVTAQPSPQGVGPIDADQAAALDDLAVASDRAMALTGEPDADTEALLRRAYGAWLATNGVIAEHLPHHAFFEYLRTRQ